MAFLSPLPLPVTRFHHARKSCFSMIRAPPARPQTQFDLRPNLSISASTVVTTAPVSSVVSAPPVALPVSPPVAPLVSPPVAPPAAPPAVPPVSPPNPSLPIAPKPTSKQISKSRSRSTLQHYPRDQFADVLKTSSRRDRQREYYYDDLSPRRQVRGRRAPKPQQIHSDTHRESHKARRSTNADDSIRSYLHEIGEVKLLDADTEVHLAREIAKLLELERISARLKDATGVDPPIVDWAAAANMDIEAFRDTLRRGLRAKEHMVAANLRLVVSIAKKYMNRGLTFQDLIQEGSIGLIRGAEKFDGNKGFKFSTYATWWIRQAITRAIADHSRPIRLPVHVNDTIAAIRKTTKQMHAEMNRPPTEAEVAERMQIGIEKLRFLARSSRSTISLETPIGKDGRESNATLGSFIVWGGDNPEEATMKSLLREDLENVLNTLSPRERDVVRMRYGFDDGKMKTLEEIGSIFAVTRERIRQIEAKALRKLRHPNRNAVLREYVYEEQ